MTTQDLDQLADHETSLEYISDPIEREAHKHGVKVGFLKALTMVQAHVETVNQFHPQGEGNSPIEVVGLQDILQPFQDLLNP